MNVNEFKKYATKHVGLDQMLVDHYIQTASNVPDLNNMTEYVIEERQTNFRPIDVFTRLIMDRIIFLGTEVNSYTANVVQAQLLFLESVDPKRDIQIFINSPGGSVVAGLGIYDTMQYVTPDIATICTGYAASMGAVLLAAGKKGKRTCLPHSRVMIHQPMGGMQGQVSDMEISYKLIKQMQEELYQILSKHTGQSVEQIEKDCDRDNWMRAKEAMEYGLVDEVLERKSSPAAV